MRNSEARAPVRSRLGGSALGLASGLNVPQAGSIATRMTPGPVEGHSIPAKRGNWGAVTVITVGPSRIRRPGTRSRAVTRPHPLACGLSVAVTVAVDDFQVSTVTGLSLAASSDSETRRSMWHIKLQPSKL